MSARNLLGAEDRIERARSRELRGRTRLDRGTLDVNMVEEIISAQSAFEDRVDGVDLSRGGALGVKVELRGFGRSAEFERVRG